ncbi:acyl transferase [Flammeovirgaceae bacterium SG7u.111]|nr:acyl transferase [Flammeovirgaceae bacterium SG7u.132]WPO33947.1 acyl transferase [Flammeovirgaceae bacterium SG7u.111]
MTYANKLKQAVLDTKKEGFHELALEIFRFQAKEIPVYGEYLKHLKIDPAQIGQIENIPFMPIEFFKSQTVLRKGVIPKLTFESSGTTGANTSRHFVGDPDFYKEISIEIFESIYGSLSDYCILALLPSYLERQNSSLVFMAEQFIAKASEGSGFYLHDLPSLVEKAIGSLASGKKVLILGVTFALLDLAESYSCDLEGAIVMETGGMKGRRKEMLREEVHHILKKGLNLKTIHSEYGMTELLSQFYATQDGLFQEPLWARLLLRDMSDPFSLRARKTNGGINVIDLANIDSCCFIETKDIGKQVGNGLVSVVGRFDNADIRGCNLLIS